MLSSQGRRNKPINVESRCMQWEGFASNVALTRGLANMDCIPSVWLRSRLCCFPLIIRFMVADLALATASSSSAAGPC